MAQIIFKLSGEDKELVFEAAHIARMSMSEFIRQSVVVKANEVIKGATK